MFCLCCSHVCLCCNHNFLCCSHAFCAVTITFCVVATSGRGHNKFADASKVLYGEQFKQQPVNGTATQFITLNGGNGALPAPATNGTLSSVNSQRMSLNINPLNELEEGYQGGAPNGDVQVRVGHVVESRK